MPILARRLILSLPLAACAGAADPNDERDARKAMDRFMAAFNSRDVRALSATLNYPHVLFDFYGVGVYHNGEDFERRNANYVA